MTEETKLTGNIKGYKVGNLICTKGGDVEEMTDTCRIHIDVKTYKKKHNCATFEPYNG